MMLIRASITSLYHLLRLSSPSSPELANRLKNGIVEEKELGIFYETNKLKRGLTSSPAHH